MIGVTTFKQFTAGVDAFKINHDWGRCVQNNSRLGWFPQWHRRVFVYLTDLLKGPVIPKQPQTHTHTHVNTRAHNTLLWTKYCSVSISVSLQFALVWTLCVPGLEAALANHPLSLPSTTDPFNKRMFALIIWTPARHFKRRDKLDIWIIQRGLFWTHLPQSWFISNACTPTVNCLNASTPIVNYFERI